MAPACLSCLFLLLAVRPKGLSSFGPAQRRVCGVGRGQVLAAGIGVGSRKGSRRRNLRPTDGACYLPSPLGFPACNTGIPKGKLPFGLSGALFLSSAFCALMGKRERAALGPWRSRPGRPGGARRPASSVQPAFRACGGEPRGWLRGREVSEGAGIGSVRSMTLLRRREERQDAGGEKRRPHGASDGAGQSNQL